MSDLSRAMFMWTDDDKMTPVRHFLGLCQRHLVYGQIYEMAIEEGDDVSIKSRRRYHACVREAYKNLPHGIAEHFKSPNHLRKWVLVKLGYVKTEQSFILQSAADAYRHTEMVLRLDQDAITQYRGNIAKVWIAKSQSRRDMKKDEITQSQDDVLDYIAAMVGVSTDDLYANADRAA